MRCVAAIICTGLATAALPAVELADGLSLDGYGEAFARAERNGAGNPHNSAAGTATARDETLVEFPSDLALQLGYHVDAFTLRSDVIVASKPLFDSDHALLEQCFIDWRATGNLTVRAGRFQNTWLGWEGFHTPELWRVNHSAAWDWNVQTHDLAPKRPFVSDGVGIKLAASDVPVSAEFYVVDDILGDGTGKKASDKGVGASFAWKPAGVGRVELGLAWDPHSVNDGDGTYSAAAAIDLNADITAFRASGWFFAAEAQYHHHPYLTVGAETYGNDLVALAMANYEFAPGSASLTAMVDYVERGFRARDNEVLEFALAVLTRPHPQVRLDGELFYWSETAAHADSYGAAAVILLQLP